LVRRRHSAPNGASRAMATGGAEGPQADAQTMMLK